MKNLVSSYTRLMLAVYSGELRGGVGMRSGMLLPPHCIQPTQFKCSYLLSFLIINLKMANEKGRNM